MYLVFRDEIGTVCVEVDSLVSFLDGKVFFTITKVIDDTLDRREGTDMCISADRIVEIGKVVQ